MTWIQVLTIILANVSLCVTLFLWVRKEANADRKELSGEMREFRKMWAQETKEFHARLCLIDERSRR